MPDASHHMASDTAMHAEPRPSRTAARAAWPQVDAGQLVLRLGPYSFRPAIRKLRHHGDGRVIHLTWKEAAILEYLYAAGGATMGRLDMLRDIWGYPARITTHTLESHVYRLRRKIEPDPRLPTLVISEGGGYRLEMA